MGKQWIIWDSPERVVWREDDGVKLRLVKLRLQCV